MSVALCAGQVGTPDLLDAIPVGSKVSPAQHPRKPCGPGPGLPGHASAHGPPRETVTPPHHPGRPADRSIHGEMDAAAGQAPGARGDHHQMSDVGDNLRDETEVGVVRKSAMDLEHVQRMDLLDERVWVCGDWHGNVQWAQAVIPALRRIGPSVTTILHLGDWWMEPGPVDYWCERAGIERVLVTLGNHEPYDVYAPILAAHPGHAVRISDVVWILPRPWSFSVGGREFLSLGGAASIDRAMRTPGEDWWPDEAILDEHVEAAISSHADVMVTHETPGGTPVAEVQALLATPPIGSLDRIDLHASALSRAQIDRVWDAVRPGLLIHGHMHVAGEGADDGRRVAALHQDGADRNVALLDLESLQVSYPSLESLRGW